MFEFDLFKFQTSYVDLRQYLTYQCRIYLPVRKGQNSGLWLLVLFQTFSSLGQDFGHNCKLSLCLNAQFIQNLGAVLIWLCSF